MRLTPPRPTPAEGTGTERAPSFADVLRSRLFLSLYVAETQSVLGDQLARVALSILVFERTHSTTQTAIAYALTFLPALVGGALLSGLADRSPQWAVMVGTDLARAGLLAVMAISDLPIVVLFLLLTVVVLLGPAFTAAEVSLLAAAFTPERFRTATGLRMMTNQLAQVAGFALGGAIVTLLDPQWALRVDACSFALSALLIAQSSRVRPARESAPADSRQPGSILGIATVLHWLRHDRQLRALVGLTWLAGFFVVPEGLAAPYAAAINTSTASIGILMAAIPAGSVTGAYIVLRRVRPVARPKLIRYMAVLTGLPLLASGAEPAMPISFALWVLSGLFAAYLLDVMTSVVQLTPEDRRGRMVGLVGAGLVGIQGVGLVTFGVVADHIGAGAAIALAGGIGAALAVPLALAARRSEVMDTASTDVA
jgi:predicted MFS family arabinose efflux permease